MATLKNSGRVTKQKCPVHGTPSSRDAGRKTKGSMVDASETSGKVIKQRNPIHDTPSSNSVGKKSKGSMVNMSENEINKCLVCEDVVLEASEHEEGHEAVFYEGDYQGWIHRKCAGLTCLAFDNLSECILYLCLHCTFTKQYKEICTLKDTIQKLSYKLAALEGTQTSQAKAVPIFNQKSINLSRNISGNKQVPLSDKKVNVVVYMA